MTSKMKDEVRRNGLNQAANRRKIDQVDSMPRQAVHGNRMGLRRQAMDAGAGPNQAPAKMRRDEPASASYEHAGAPPFGCTHDI